MCLNDLRDADVAKRRDPSVRQPADEPQHPRTVRTDPDLHLVRRERARVVAMRGVIGALNVHGSLATPRLANDGDCLLQRIDGLARRAPRSTHGRNRIPEPASPQTQLESATAEHVERGRLLGEHHGWPKGKICDVGEQPDPLGLGEQVRHQHPHVQKPPLVGVVLNADQVQTSPIGSRDRRANRVELGGRGDYGEAELDRPSVVHLGPVLARRSSVEASAARVQAAARARCA